MTAGTAHGERIVVPDASVILKWIDRLPGEKDRERADALLDAWLNGRLEVVVPPLWAFEVASVLGRKDPLGAGPIMEDLLGYRFVEADPTPELCRVAFGLVKEFRVTYYDAVYHAVALLRKGVLITADEAYIRKAGRRGGVALLRDFIPV